MAIVLFWVTLVLTIAHTNAGGEFTILYSPDSLLYSESGETFESLLKEILSASLGLSVDQNAEWMGLNVMDPFNTPEAVVEIYIDGITSMGNNPGFKAKTYPLIVDEFEPNTYKVIKHRIKKFFGNEDNKLISLRLSDENEISRSKEFFGELTPSFINQSTINFLKYSIEEDYQFINELGILIALIDKIKKGALVPDNVIDYYNFRFRSLHGLSDFHGPNSVQIKEAKKVLGYLLRELSKAFVRAYDGSVLVASVSSDVAHTRRSARSLDLSPDADPKWPFDWIEPPLNWLDNPDRYILTDGSPNYEWVKKAKLVENGENDQYDANFSAMFNILLWFNMAMIFIMLSIMHSFMDMDPGRDSIIYRMTTTRGQLKKSL